MSNREPYSPGAPAGAEVRKEGDDWTLLLVRELRHPPEKVWRALTDPEQLREWAPFDADRTLDTSGPVKLSTVGAPTPQVSETTVKRAEAPKLLEYNWGGNDIRWQLEPVGGGNPVDALAQHRSALHLLGCRRLAHLLRRSRPLPRRRADRAHGGR